MPLTGSSTHREGILQGTDKDRRGIIRPLQAQDRQPILELLKQTGMFTERELSIALELVDTVLTTPGQQDYIIYVYEADKEVLGYYCVGPTPATVGTFDLYWIAVTPSEHGRGIGGTLDRHAEMLIRSLGGRLILAETSSQAKYKKTHKFYLRRGYAELSRIKDYYRSGDDLVVYGKYIHQAQEGGK